MRNEDQPAATPEAPNPFLKLVLELGPLVIFFFSNGRFGIITATAIFMVAATVALILMWLLFKRVAVMPLVSTVVVLVFGGLTVWLNDELFIKLKPTIVNTMFGTILLGAYFLNKPLLKIVLDAVFEITDAAWQVLTLRWALFFFFLAVLNEVIWRNFSTDFWVAFKVWGVMPISMAFALSQLPFIQKHSNETDEASQPGE